MRWPIPVFLVASFALAQTNPAVSPSDADKKKIRVDGTVTSLTGELIRKATVRLQPTGPAANGQPPATYSEATDEAGKFVFDNVAAGRYSLTVEKAGFLTQRYGARSTNSPGTILVFTEGETRSNLAIKMTPQGVISGRILDRDGDPFSGAQVQALRYTYRNGKRTLATSGTATTNDQGDYRIANVPPGKYYLSAADRRQTVNITSADRSRAPAEGNVTTFYPNGLDASSSAPVDVTPGVELRGIDFRMRREKIYWIRGKVVDTAGAVPAQTLLRFAPKDTTGQLSLQNTAILRDDGAFEFRSLVPGTYVLQTAGGATVNGVRGNAVGRMEITISDSNIENVVFPLSSASSDITGTVRYEAGDPGAAQQSQQAQPAQPTQQPGTQGTPPPTLTSVIALISVDDNIGITGQASPDGTFRISGVTPGKYYLNALRLPNGGYVKSARFGGQDVTHAPIDNTSGAGGMIEVILSSKSASVSGMVHNDQGDALAGAIVTLWPRTRDNSTANGGVRTTATDQNGAFKLAGIPPGDYYAASFEDLDAGLATYVDFLNHFTGDAATLQLDESGQGNADIKVVSLQKTETGIAKLP